MGVRVRLRPMELTASVEHVEFSEAETYFIHDDNTLELYDAEGNTVAHVHGGRWDIVELTRASS